MTQTLSQLENRDAFIERHIGPDAQQQQEMLNAVGAESLNALIGQIVPKDIPLTSFSILMARYKGDLTVQIAGAQAIEDLKDGDTVLISEGCTHHRQCDDIGTVKMPRWIREYTGKDLHFAFTSGTEFPKDLSPYALVVHCGGCTLPLQEMRYRISYGDSQKVAITNYGVMIAYIHGILPRVTETFVDKKR